MKERDRSQGGFFSGRAEEGERARKRSAAPLLRDQKAEEGKKARGAEFSAVKRG